MSDIPKEIQAFQAGLKAALVALPPKPQPEVKGSLFNTGIRPAVDQWLLKKAEEERDYGEYWSASSAGYCMRKVIFERLGVPKIESDGDARRQRVFTAGHLFHSWIQGITKEAGLSIAQELELEDTSLMIRGHIDDLVLIKAPKLKVRQETAEDATQRRAGNPNYAVSPHLLPKDHLILYDYKTVNSRAFMWAKKKGNAISHYHRLQLGTYLYLLRKINPTFHDGFKGNYDYDRPPIGQDLTEARILKIEKDSLMMGEQQLMWTPDLERDVVQYWHTLNGYWKKKTIPKCTCADFEGGFMAKEAYNGYFYDGEPCSLQYYREWQEKTK